MKKLGTLWAAGLACGMVLGTCMTSYANFQWKVEDGKYLGTATLTLINSEGIPYQQEAVIISDGAVVTFTESDYEADYGESVYDYNGNYVGGALGLAVDTGYGILPGNSFEYPIHSNLWVEKEYNGNGLNEVGVFEIGTQEYSATGYIDSYWYKCFVIDGKFNPALMSNVQRVDTAASATVDPTTDTTIDTTTTSTNDPASALVYTWKNDAVGWWLEASDGTYLVNSWYTSPESGLCYYMGADGYMLTNTTTPDGYFVNADGVWVQ